MLNRQSKSGNTKTGPAPDRAGTTPDAELVRAAQRGDKRAFVEIVARHQAMVCGIALAILKDFAASEDAAQEAFLTAWRKLHDLREPEKLRAWLAQISRNAALGHRRRTRSHDSLEEAPILPDDAPSPDEAAASGEEAMLVRESLAKLPEMYRLPLVLFYRDGQSVRAVAEALEISEDAVKQRLARGREMLRDRMAGLVETVLTRTAPTTIFTMTVAAAIGALAAPAAVAGGAFAASAGAAGGTTSSSSLLTAMSTSKTFLVTTALVALACIPIGYQISASRPAVDSTKVSPRTEAATTRAPKPFAPDFADSTLFAEWRELHERHGTNSQAMPALYKAIAGLKDPFRRRAFRSALIAEWVQVDPAGGLVFFLGKEPDETQRQQFFEEWLALDARAAVEALIEQSSSNPAWDEMTRPCLPEIARRLPSRLPEVASRLPKPDNYYDTAVRDAFALLAEGDLASSRKLAEAVTGPAREQALSGIARVWARGDVDGAIAWASKLPDGMDRDELVRAALLGKATVDPATALDLAGSVPSGGKHAYGSSTTGARILVEAAKTDFDATVAWLVAHPGRFAHEDLLGLSEAVTERLTGGAAAFLTGRVEDGSLAALLPAIGSALLNRSGGQKAEVWEWLKTQPGTEATRALQNEVLNFAGYHDPDLALRLVAEVPRTPAGDQQVQEVARCLFNGGNRLYRFDALYPQAPERLRQPLLDAAFRYLGADNMDDPQRWIARVSQLPDASRAAGTEAIARAWAKQTPEETAGWVDSLPPGEARNKAVAAAVTSWSARDVGGAAAWIGAMAGAERDRAAGALAAAIAERSPQDAWQWALSINDDAERSRAAIEAATAMAARDPATARQWIETGPFTPEAKLDLQSAVERNRQAKAAKKR